MPLGSNLGLGDVFCILFSVIALCHCECHFMDDLIVVSKGFAYLLAFQKWDKNDHFLAQQNTVFLNIYIKAQQLFLES